jgi:hypothetical protein
VVPLPPSPGRRGAGFAGAVFLALLDQEGTTIATLRLFETLPRHPVVTVTSAMRATGVARPTAGKVIETPVAGGILVETTGKRRDRSFSYERYLARLREGTELG